MERIKKYKYWIIGVGALLLIGFLLIQLGVVNTLFTSQAMFFVMFAAIIGGAFAVLALIQRYY